MTRRIPVYWHDELVEAIPRFEARFDSYEEYATATIGDILTDDEREAARRLTASTFETSIFYRRDGSFQRHPLPTEAQFAPIQGLAVHDVNGDGRPDLLLAGNDFTVRPQWGRSDAEKGTVLLNQGRLQFETLRSQESGFFAPKDVRALAIADGPSGSLLIVGNNNAPVSTFLLPPLTE